jgi:hypothetical protein
MVSDPVFPDRVVSAAVIVSEDIGAAEVLSLTSIGSCISAGGEVSFFSQLRRRNPKTANANENFIIFIF